MAAFEDGIPASGPVLDCCSHSKSCEKKVFAINCCSVSQIFCGRVVWLEQSFLSAVITL